MKTKKYYRQSKKGKKNKKTKRHGQRKLRGGMLPSYDKAGGYGIYYPYDGYREGKKSEEYLDITHQVMISIMRTHVDSLIGILANMQNKFLYLTDLSNLGGEVRERSVSPDISDDSDSDRSQSRSPISVEPGPTGYNLEEKVIRPQVTTITAYNKNYEFINISKTDLTLEERQNAKVIMKLDGGFTLKNKDVPGMPGISRTDYRYEIIVYGNTPQIRTICILIKEKVGDNYLSVTNHGVDDVLLWVLFKMSILEKRTMGATIITNDKMRFINSGDGFDKFLFQQMDKIRRPIELGGRFNSLVIPDS